MENNYPRIVPPKEMFKGSTELVPLVRQNDPSQLITPTIAVEYPDEGGVLSYLLGDKYPAKGWLFAEAVFCMDTIKRKFMNDVRFFLSSPLRYITALFYFLPSFLKRKVINSYINEFQDYCYIVFERWGRIMRVGTDGAGNPVGIRSIVLESKRYCDVAREVYRVLFEMWGEQRLLLINAICMTLEYDDGWRYRIQDGFGEINLDNLKKDCGKELARVFRLMIERGEGTGYKIETFLKVIPYICRIKIFKEGILTFFEKADQKKLALDEIDLYRVLLWGGYKFKGMPDNDRLSLRMILDAEWTYFSTKADNKMKLKI